MKKILSIILAAMLIVGMIPTAFASDTEADATSVTYTFNMNQHGEGVTSGYLERDDGTKTRTSDSTSGGEWAYLGTTSTTLYSDYFASLTGDRAYFNLSADSFAAFKIKVPLDGKYKVTEFKAYLWRDKNTAAARDVKMYIVQMTDELKSDSTVWGTASSGERTGAFALESLITAEPLGTLSYSVPSTTPGLVDVSAFSTVNDMKADAEYALIFYSAGGGTFGPQSFTLTEQAPEVTVAFDAESYTTDEDGTVQLRSTLTSDGTDITASATAVAYESDDELVATVDSNGLVTGVKAGTANITVTYTYGGKTYSATVPVMVNEIDRSKTYTFNKTTMDGTVEATLGGCDTVVDSYLQIVGRKEYYNKESAEHARAVLKINVAYNGTYDISARISKITTGTEADVYIIPVSNSVSELTFSYLKTLPILGRVNGVGDGNENQLIGTTTLTAGDYYIVFNLNSDNTATGNYGKQSLNLRSLTLAESTGVTENVEETTASTPSFMVATNVQGASVTVTGAGNGPVYSVARGTTVTLTPEEVDGYNFVGWMRGAYEDNGKFSKFVDLTENEDGTYSYRVWTHTYLTAVYEPETVSGEKVVKFWNYDGRYYGEKPVSQLDQQKLPDDASLIGHTFKGWWVANNTPLDINALTAPVTNAVAHYDVMTTVGENDYDKVVVNGKDQSNTAFNTKVICLDEKPNEVTHWLRDGKIVSYNSEYIHWVWDGTNIYSSYADVTPKPLVVLEDTTIGGAYMIEYEAPVGYTIVEVGILFNKDTTSLERYTSQKGTSRGQFAAIPESAVTTVCGYMIYTDAKGDAYVIYSE
ncbi:MAG: Ig-like domain-containing protein [Oscillospiraceae bacterium]|nr:Ig-like domain-containing protein [Oscillospiraceae bacterium]